MSIFNLISLLLIHQQLFQVYSLFFVYKLGNQHRNDKGDCGHDSATKSELRRCYYYIQIDKSDFLTVTQL